MAKYDANQIMAQAEEAAGGTDIEFDWNGQTYTMPNPAFQDDDWTAEWASMTDATDSGEFLLGVEQYAAFKSNGGKNAVITGVLASAGVDYRDTLVDGRPTRSATSSRATRKQPKRR